MPGTPAPIKPVKGQIIFQLILGDREPSTANCSGHVLFMQSPNSGAEQCPDASSESHLEAIGARPLKSTGFSPARLYPHQERPNANPYRAGVKVSQAENASDANSLAPREVFIARLSRFQAMPGQSGSNIETL